MNIFHSFSFVLQNTYLLLYVPDFLILSAESHIPSIHLPQTLGDLGEISLFILSFVFLRFIFFVKVDFLLGDIAFQ